MIKGIFKAVVLALLMMSCYAWSADFNNLRNYQTSDSVVNIFDDSNINNAVKVLTGNEYNSFIANFQAFGDPKVLKDGGLFIEGWLPHLRLENASAFVIEPDGKLYAAWLNPDNNYIHYITNDHAKNKIQENIQQWSFRFEGVNFNHKPSGNIIKQKIPDVSYFNTKNYSAKITLLCSDRSIICTKALLKITYKPDNSSHSVLGVINNQDCHKSDCPAESLTFENKNTNTRYFFSLEDNDLLVSTVGKSDVYEKGKWQ
ncbi:hypothetical protein [Pantoea cypripedii]|uniref:Uncharacterized protein n=1 Tax=Pantoea cypripedii TaxID=55209 RepID=A0A6B9FZM0_PANCY|nr:hypothetical protein [Pantoea cypripedii]QGY29698.1 hypothetical protein CUN67_12465 [Pantoea cypripedii]